MNARLNRVLLLLAACALAALARADETPPFFFIQLADPQFGMYEKDAGFAQETANFEFAIATVNRLKPAFVAVSGDLVHKPGDPAQCDEYLRIVGKLDRSIRLYQMPGNHDVGNVPTPESLAAYAARFGPDRYSFRHGNQTARDGDFEMVVTGPIGQPLRKDGSGMRVVIVRGDRIEHRYYEMGRVPNKIDLTAKSE